MIHKMKICTTCRKEKPIAAFPKDPTHSRCKTCKNDQAKASYRRNATAAKARAKRWAADNRARRRQVARQWQRKNKDRIKPAILANQRRRYHADLERQRAYFREYARKMRLKDPGRAKRLYAANRDKHRARAAEYARLHPGASKRRYHANIEHYRAKGRADAQTFKRRNPKAYQVIKRRSEMKRRSQKKGVAVIERVNPDRICARDKMRCHICRRKVKRAELHFDHVIPLSKGGSHTEANIAVSHGRCNLAKGSKRLSLF